MGLGDEPGIVGRLFLLSSGDAEKVPETKVATPSAAALHRANGVIVWERHWRTLT